MNSDMLQISLEDLIETMSEGLIVLGDDLTVQFANRTFCRMFSITLNDAVGHKIYALSNGQWDIPALRTLLENILPQETAIDSFEVDHEFPVIGRRTIRLNARKVLRTGDNAQQILVAVENVTHAAELQRENNRQRLLAQGIVDTIREPLLVLDGDLIVIAASRSFYQTFEVEQAATVGSKLWELGNGQWNISRLRHLLEQVIPEHTTMEDFEVVHTFPSIGEKTMLLNARKIYHDGNNTKTFLLAIEDVTERCRLQAERDRALDHAELLLQELNHRIMNSLSIISSMIRVELRQFSDPAARAVFDRVLTRIMAVAELYKTLAISGTVDAVDAQVFLGSICSDIIGALQNDQTPVAVTVEVDTFEITSGTAVPVGLLLNELLINCIKYAFPDRAGGEIRISATLVNGDVTLSVGDNGVGIDENARVDSGIGGMLVDMFARQLHGSLTRESDNRGTTVQLVFPLAGIAS